MHVALLSYILFWTVQLAFGQGSPTHTVTSFQGLPHRLFFFDDSEAAIYFDSQTGLVHVSQDEGKSWKIVEDIKEREVVMVIEHPFDNKVAFALTTSKRHWRTTDRGKTWRHFEMPISPAIVARPLSFHSKKPGYILYQGTKCTPSAIGWGESCLDETYYTKEAFGDDPKLLLSDVSRCQFAHSSKDWQHTADEDLVYCVAFDASAVSGSHSIQSSRLFSSTKFFATQQDTKVEDLGIGKNAKGVVAFAIVSKFAMVALRDLSPSSRNGEMLLYVTTDTQTWAKALFPHASSAQLRENAYTIVESTTHSLAIDVVLEDSRGGAIGNLFVSNSNGTYFTPSLKDTNRNDWGFVDFERVEGVEGVGLANIVANARDVEGRAAPKQLRTRITFDDGRTWEPLPLPEGERGACTSESKEEECSLNLHSVTNPHNYGRIFSSPAPGLLIGVGTVSPSLLPYSRSQTYLSIDAGKSWKKVKDAPHKFEFGDSGSIIVVVNDEEDAGIDFVEYSLDFGKTFTPYKFDKRIRAKALVTVPDSTSQKFILVGETGDGEAVTIHIDFAQTRKRQCVGRDTKNGDPDFEKWYARPRNHECLMGHKQYYTRRKPTADCYVGEKFKDPVPQMEDCECDDNFDYECDFNYIRSGNECIEMGPEPIPANECSAREDAKYMGSSGWRKIPGDTCRVPSGKKAKDDKVEKDCSKAAPKEGSVIHQMFTFPSQIVQHAYFKNSKTILVRLMDGSIWQSSNEGYSWQEPVKGEKFVVFYHHKFASDRAYLLTSGRKFHATTNFGRSWDEKTAPLAPNSFSSQVLRFHPDSEKLIWTGNKDCDSNVSPCHAESHYSTDNGRGWTFIEDYVKNCAWAKDTKLSADPTEIICESYRTKKGKQRDFNQFNNALELVEGKDYFKKKTKVFDRVVGFAKFSEYLVVAELKEDRGNTLELQVSLDGVKFAKGLFPPSLDPHTHAYTVLESSTNSLFLHMTTSERPSPYWGHLLKSNSNGTYFNIILENVNRNEFGYVDFEKVIGLDGIALVNVVSNPGEATITGSKEVQSKITHNDGGSWKTLQPPEVDSLGNPYSCTSTKCVLNVHGYTERTDPRATYSSPSTIGVLLAVGNVGEALAPYTSSDTFLSRDAGFTWTEIHKDAHLWEFGDSGSILVLANDEEPTDHILFSTDEGVKWREYKFTTSSTEKVRVWSIVTVQEDTSRKFILFGMEPRSSKSVAIHVDFSALTNKKCVFNDQNPQQDDFEPWSPSEERNEVCLFGKKTIYYRRKRDANCFVGDKDIKKSEETEICQCTNHDFECEFNHVRNENGECELVAGTTPLPDSEEACNNGADFWYSRTAYRKIPHSECDGGSRPDRGTAHACPGFKNHSGWFWFFVIIIPFGFTALVAWWYYNKSGMARGSIRLPGDGGRYYSSGGGFIDTLASVPWFLIGVTGIAWEWVVSTVERLPWGRSRRGYGYRNIPVDEDAHILRFEDEE